MKTISEFAELLNGREYCHEITLKEEAEAKEAGIVVVFGFLDNTIDFRGAIRDEADCSDGGEIFVIKEGVFSNRCKCDDCPYFINELWNWEAKKITAVWKEEGYSWIYRTEIPHKTFEILEDGEPYCRGIVFLLSDIEAGPG